jgi:hypothetical protein
VVVGGCDGRSRLTVVSYPLGLTADAVAWLALAGVALGVLGLLVAAWSLRRLSRMRRSLVLLAADDSHQTFVDIVGRQAVDVASLRSDVAGYQVQVAQLRDDLADAIRHVAVVRYDAFGDMGGRMSFSAAMLDDAGDGLVVSSINGRTETRTYAKGVKGGSSDAHLSPEEQQAIAYARRRAGQ